MKKLIIILYLFLPLVSFAQSSRSFQYEGKVGSYPIHMQLFFRSDHTVVGSYYYDSQRAKGNTDTIRLQGIYTGDVDAGEISLKEIGSSGKEIGAFFCELSGGHLTDREIGAIFIMHWIEGGSGYRNYASNKVYEVHLECSEISEL